MFPEAAISQNYLDFQGLSKLRAAAREDSPEALEAVAKQFEGLFLKMMLKSMRDASFGDPLFDSEATGFYRDLLDHQLSLALTKGQGLGFADMIIEQLRGHVASPEPKPDDDDGDRALRIRRAPHLGLPPVQAETTEGPPSVAPAPGFDSKQGFIDALRPHAERAGRALGVQPGLLLAQAALETGWGRSVIRHPDGASSHNLFGIKANAGWAGARVSVGTVEFEDGLAVRRRAEFRAYDSFAESFDDYVGFLRAGTRYAKALQKVADPSAFVEALQAAGYATDPAYAEKILRIWREDLAGSVQIARGGPI